MLKGPTKFEILIRFKIFMHTCHHHKKEFNTILTSVKMKKKVTTISILYIKSIKHSSKGECQQLMTQPQIYRLLCTLLTFLAVKKQLQDNKTKQLAMGP